MINNNMYEYLNPTIACKNSDVIVPTQPTNIIYRNRLTLRATLKELSLSTLKC